MDFTKLHSFLGWRTELSKLTDQSEDDFRRDYVRECGFPIITSETFELLATSLVGKRVVDVGCGCGFLAKQLQDRGIDVLPIDDHSGQYIHVMDREKHCNVLKVDLKDLDIAPFDVVILSWPDHRSDMASVTARKMRKGQYLIYQGESEYGCTADNAFFTLLTEQFKESDLAYRKLNETHLGFERMHDRWHVFKKMV